MIKFITDAYLKDGLVKKTLVVTYLPSGERSRTKRLLDALLECHSGDYHVIDLIDKPPRFLTPNRIQAFIKRNYRHKPLSTRERNLVSRSDEYLRHIHESSRLVMAYPMHNFSMPAIVKAFFDAVIIKGETFEVSGNQYEGLMKGKHGLALTTSGGRYDKDSGWSDYEHCFSLQKNLFDFMGYQDGEVISVQGCDELSSEELEQRFAYATRYLQNKVSNW